jgi:hypothetical protein
MKRALYGLALLLGLPVFAQEQFKPGNVFVGADTLSGSISSQRTARFVKFKAPDGAIAEYDPGQAAGFRLDDNVFLSRQVEREVKGEKQKEALFMQLLVQGRANLYYYRERDNSEHYWIEKDHQLRELRVVETIVEVNGKPYAQTRKEYQGILGYVLADCGKINVGEVPYSRAGLTGAIFTYNTCFEGEKAAITYRRNRIMVHPGVKVGVSRPSYRALEGAAGPSYGVFVNLQHNGASRVLSTQVEWVHNRYTARTGSERFSYRALDLAALLRFTYPRGIIRPAISLGVIRSGVTASVDSLGSRMDGWRDVVYKATAEVGLVVPVRRHYLYAAGRIEPVLDEYLVRSKIYNFSVSIGF